MRRKYIRHVAAAFGILFAAVVAFVGCSVSPADRSGVGPTHLVQDLAAPQSQVAFSFQVDATASASVAGSVRAAGTSGIVTFRLLSLNIGNPANPTTATEQTVLIPPTGLVTANFLAVPAKTTIAQVDIVGSTVGSYSSFHGAGDLRPGLNVITVAPSGSGWRNDLAAHILETAVVTPTIFSKLPASAAAMAYEMTGSINRSLPTAQEDVVRAFTRLINPPRWSLTAEAVRSAQAQLLGVSGQSVNGDTAWAPGETFITETISQDEVAGMCGWSAPTEFSANLASPSLERPAVRGAALPRSLDWRNKDGKNWLTPVRNQYPYSTCVAFACCGALEAMMKIQANLDGVDLSEWALFRSGNVADLGALSRGWEFRVACEQLRVGGVVGESYVPYHLIPRFTQPPTGIRQYKADSYVLVQSVDGIKQALQNGPVVTGIRVFEDLMRYTGGVYWHATGREVGFHAILLVGYDDDRQCWIAKNSWSSGWGEQGFFRVRYTEVQTDRGYQLRFAFTSPVPTAPSGVTAMPGDREVVVSWAAAGEATSHNLYYGTVSGVRRGTGLRVPGVVSPHRLTGLRNGTTYYFVLTSENSTGESGESSEVSTTPRDPATLVPSGVTTTPADGQVAVQWTAVPQASGYRVYWSTTQGAARTGGQRFEPTSGPFTHTGLINGSTYYYQVTALVDGVETAASTEVSSRPWPQIPLAPTGVSATPGNGQNTIVWNPVPGATSYRLYHGGGSNINRTAGTRIDNASSPHVHTGLPNSTTVYYVVTALNLAGESIESAAVAATPLLAVPGDVAIVRGSSQVQLTWSAVPGASTYSIYYGESPGSLRTTGTPIHSAQPGQVISGLVNGRTYYFTVVARDPNSESAGSSVISDNPALAMATNLRVTGTRGRIVMTWDAATGVNYSIKVFFSLDGGTTWTQTTRLEGTSSGITPGVNRSVTWVSHQDFASLQPNARVRLVLNDGTGDTAPVDSGVLNIDNRVTVESLSAVAADGLYGAGSTIDVTVRFSTVVRVNGTPQLVLETGSQDRSATYLSGDNSNTLVLRYSVQPGDVSSDLDYAGTTALSLAGGTIRDDVGNDANLLLPSPGAAGSLGAARALVIDGVAPTILSLTSTTNNGVYIEGQSVNVTLSFSEPVALTGGSMTVNLDSGGACEILPFGLRSSTAANYTVSGGHASLDLDTLSVGLAAGASLRDAAGNQGLLGIPANQSLKDHRDLVIDAIAPTVTSIVRQSGVGSFTNAAAVNWRVTFSEAMDPATVNSSDFTIVDASGTITGEVVTGVTQVTSIAWDVAASTGSSGDGDLRLDVLGSTASLNDLAGHAITSDYTGGAIYSVDRTAPTITSVMPFDRGAVDVVFSEPMGPAAASVTNFTISGAAQSTLAANPSQVDQVCGGVCRLTWAAGTMNTNSSLNMSVTNLADRAGNTLTGTTAFTETTPLLFIDTVPVGDAGNAADNTDYGALGAVAYPYRIGTYEVTNEQYTVFLNAVAQTDDLQLYAPAMSTTTPSNRGGIDRSGSPGAYSYATGANWGSKPVNHLTFFDVVRFVNWLHNGARAGGNLETGAYSIEGWSGPIGARQPGARFAVPTEDEWYKAAYYKGGGLAAGYWTFATRSDTAPFVATTDAQGVISNPGTNIVNYDNGASWNGLTGNLSTVGSAGPSSTSYYGTYDQSGNVTEFIEAWYIEGSAVYCRGGTYSQNWYYIGKEAARAPAGAWYNYGFRICRPSQ